MLRRIHCEICGSPLADDRFRFCEHCCEGSRNKNNRGKEYYQQRNAQTILLRGGTLAPREDSNQALMIREEPTQKITLDVPQLPDRFAYALAAMQIALEGNVDDIHIKLKFGKIKVDLTMDDAERN